MLKTHGQLAQLQFLQNMSTYLFNVLWCLLYIIIYYNIYNYLFDHNGNSDCLNRHKTKNL